MNKVLIVINSLSGGGAELAMVSLANELVNDFHVEIISLDRSITGVRALPIPLVRGLSHREGSKWFRLLLSCFKYMFHYIRFRPDVVIVNCEVPEILVSLSPGLPRIICVQHNETPWQMYPLLGRLIRKFLNFRNPYWVAVSNHYRQWPNGEQFEIVIPNMIAKRGIALDPSYEFQEIKKLIYIGRLKCFQKNAHAILHIAKEVKLPVDFFGEGKDEKLLRELAINLQVEANFKGYLENPWQNFLSGDLLIVPSSSEADGLFLMEAVILGVPLLVSGITSFKRLDLPDELYCSGLESFITKIHKGSGSAQNFIPPKSISKKLEFERSPDIIAARWIDVINKLLYS